MTGAGEQDRRDGRLSPHRAAWEAKHSRAVALLEMGLEPAVVGQRLGLPADTIRAWRQELRAQLASDAARTRRPHPHE